MDWKYKHFDHEAVFKASHERVLEAARAIVAESLGEIEDTADGFVARGTIAWHAAIATVHITPAPDGTKMTVELLVQRASLREYMLVDIGGFYNGQIDQWFSGITQRLEGVQDQILVSKTTSFVKFQRGCLLGCLVYLVVGVCLGLFAIALDRVFFPQVSTSIPGPISILVSIFGLFAAILAYLYVTKPDASISRHIRERLQRIQNKQKKE